VQRAEEAVFHHSWRRNSRIMYGKTILGKSAYALCDSGVTRGSNLRVNSYWRIMKNRQVLSKTLE
jgi:hypothetical protein